MVVPRIFRTINSPKRGATDLHSSCFTPLEAYCIALCCSHWGCSHVPLPCGFQHGFKWVQTGMQNVAKIIGEKKTGKKYPQNPGLLEISQFGPPEAGSGIHLENDPYHKWIVQRLLSILVTSAHWCRWIIGPCFLWTTFNANYKLTKAWWSWLTR